MSGLHSHPLPVGDSEPADVQESQHFKGEDFQIEVSQAPGYLCHIKATAVFRLPPDVLFRQVIVHPDNAELFRHMDRCSYRKILEDDGEGKQKVEVAHEASFRFLIFRGKFTTHLLVEQDAATRTMRFSLKPGARGIMKAFVGVWQIEPHPMDPHACITHLDQDVAIGVFLPPPLPRFLKAMTCNQVKRIFEDVQAEARKINSGQPTLRPWEQVQLTEIGVEPPATEQPQHAPG